MDASKLLASPSDVEVGGVPSSPPAAVPFSAYSPPFLGLLPTLTFFLNSLFHLVTFLALLPLRLIVALFISPLISPSYKGPTPEPQRVTSTDKLEDIPRLVADLKTSFSAGSTRSHAWREQQILGIRAMVLENHEEFFRAYQSDIGKPYGDWFLEKNSILGECNHTLAHLRSYMQTERRSTPLWMQPGSTYIVKEPLGTVLIIGPYNYPANLVLCPLIAAFAAGCNAVVKPSEQMPALERLLAELLPKYISPAGVAVVTGAVPQTTALLEQKWDKIFFTGSERVAQIIEKKVAGTLTPLCLELGGKSPVIVDSSANMAVTARRVCQGKWLNAGATCIAPDYVLVEEKAKDRFVTALRKQITKCYGENPQESKDYCRVLNKMHMDRLLKYMDDAKAKGATVEAGGVQDQSDRYMAPTVLTNVTEDMECMQEEIFGPILPIITVPSVDAAVKIVLSRPKPLASYVFSGRSDTQQKVLRLISSGSACVNDTTVQVLSPDIPFGGVGPAGMGAYHGREGFLCFSHCKSVYHHDTLTDSLTWFRYPPFTGFAEGVLGIVLGKSW
jgi:aldehyde dehydrogenase (NAD+)